VGRAGARHARATNDVTDCNLKMVCLEIQSRHKPYFGWNGLVGFARSLIFVFIRVGVVYAVCKPEVLAGCRYNGRSRYQRIMLILIIYTDFAAVLSTPSVATEASVIIVSTKCPRIRIN
jgi:hypothetical protein